MDQTTFEYQLSCNREAYYRLREEIRRNYEGQYVAIAQGQLIGAAATYEDALTAIQRLCPRPEHFIVFEAGYEPAFEIVDDFKGGF